MSFQISLPWIAGFFDGEGCVSIERRARGRHSGYRLVAQITQNDRRPLDMIAEIYGGSVSIVGPQRRCHRWRVPAERAAKFLEEIAPHLIVKAEAVALALPIQRSHLPRGERHTPASSAERERIYERFNKRARP